MAPLKHCSTDEEELIGKALLMDSFISDSSDVSEVQTTEPAEVKSISFRDNRGSIVIALKNCPKPEPLQEYDEEPERKLSVKHELKAKMALFAVVFLIGFMAVFAFMTIKKDREKSTGESVFNAMHLGYTMGNETEVTDTLLLNATKIVNGTKVNDYTST